MPVLELLIEGPVIHARRTWDRFTPVLVRARVEFLWGDLNESRKEVYPQVKYP